MGNVVSINVARDRTSESEPREPKIVTYLHCALCCEDVPEGMSMQEYAMMEVGFTVEGIQIWCRRHNASVVHLDFEGQKFPAIAG